MYRIRNWMVILIFLVFSVQITATPYKASMNTQRLAFLETSMWRAYYEQDYIRLSYRLYQLFREEFNLNNRQTVRAAWHATQAARVMRKLPGSTTHESYQQKIVPHLTSFFKVIKEAGQGNWDEREVAKAELEWWVTRRSPDKLDLKKIGRQIAKVYVIIGGQDNQYIQQAGYLRAQAAYLRDQQKIKYNKVQWKSIEKILKRSYDNLHKGMLQSRLTPHLKKNTALEIN